MFLCAISIFIFKCSILWISTAEVLLLMPFVHDDITVTLRLITCIYVAYPQCAVYNLCMPRLFISVQPCTEVQTVNILIVDKYFRLNKYEGNTKLVYIYIVMGSLRTLFVKSYHHINHILYFICRDAPYFTLRILLFNVVVIMIYLTVRFV